MRRKRSKRNDIVIDLTSLLDVIFIFLLVFLLNQQSYERKIVEQTRQLQGQISEAEAVKSESEALKQLYQDQIDSANAGDTYFLPISVNASYNESRVSERTVRILVRDGELKEFSLSGKENNEEFEAISSYLREQIEKSKIPVLLSLNEQDERILYRDEKALKELFSELRKDYPGVFEK